MQHLGFYFVIFLSVCLFIIIGFAEYRYRAYIKCPKCKRKNNRCHGGEMTDIWCYFCGGTFKKQCYKCGQALLRKRSYFCNRCGEGTRLYPKDNTPWAD